MVLIGQAVHCESSRSFNGRNSTPVMALVGSLNEPLLLPCLLVGVECCFYLDLTGFWAVFGLS